MAQIPTSLYQNIAEDFDTARSTMLDVPVTILTAVNRIVDLTTATTGALGFEINLLSPFYSTYNAVNGITTSSAAWLAGVRAINNYVIDNSDVAVSDALASFVNSIWTCVPTYWAALSEDAGFDITEWNVCS